jgi:hypothetical protein
MTILTELCKHAITRRSCESCLVGRNRRPHTGSVIGTSILKEVVTLSRVWPARGPIGALATEDTTPTVRRSMFGHVAAAAVLDSYDFTGVSTLVDIGGASSALLAQLLQAYPTLLGILIDLPPLVAAARRQLKAVGVADRCTVVAADFLASVPAAGDVYVLARVLRDWDDPSSLRILANCRRAMSSRGRLLLIERVLPSRMQAIDAGAGGRERTEAQYGALLALSGLTITDIIPARGVAHIIEATPA